VRCLKTGRSTDQPDEWQQDLNPDPMAGRNYGLEGHTGERCPDASEIKDLHSVLKDYTNAELKQIPVLPQSRLEQGAEVH